MWIPREKAAWTVIPENLQNFQIVRNIDDRLFVTIHNREKDNKIMVSLLGLSFDKKDKRLWTTNEYQFLDLCQFLSHEIDKSNKSNEDGKEIVLQATRKIYNICGLNKNIDHTDKIDDIINSYKEETHVVWKEWKIYTNFLSVFFYSRDEYVTKSGKKSKYGRSIGLTSIITMLKYDIPPEKAYNIFAHESGYPMGEIPNLEIERILTKYSVPQSPCRNYDKGQKSIENAWLY